MPCLELYWTSLWSWQPAVERPFLTLIIVPLCKCIDKIYSKATLCKNSQQIYSKTFKTRMQFDILLLETMFELEKKTFYLKDNRIYFEVTIEVIS